MSEDTQSKMEAIQRAYLESLAGRRDDIRAAVDGLETDASDDSTIAALDAIRHHAHKTAGSGATFGFPAISTAAKSLELLCDDLLEKGSPFPDETRAGLAPQIEDLLRAINAATGGGPDGKMAPAPTTKSNASDIPDSRIVLMVTTDPDIGEGFCKGIEAFGYQVVVASGLNSRPTLPDGARLTAAIIDMPRAEDGTPDGSDVIKGHAEGWLTCPVIFLSDDGGLDSRLAAVRAGAETYFVKPVRLVELVDALDRLTFSDEDEPHRVLIVDDDVSVSRYNEAILKGAGMITEVINDPTEFLHVLESFSPEIILMDLYMPDCNGQELASIIRQNEEFAGMPIVFLSSETDINKQIGAMSHGGDGFLTKPISPKHLIDSVRVRANRFRMIRNLMVRDGLTGLYNHTTTKQLLENEIARATRDKTPLSFAMVDIDKFKSVNDTYGHGVGDRVIKSLSRLLRQRLRATDIVGRMGGEEFGIILPGAGGEVAKTILDAIRVSFSEIDQSAENTDFHVTFSCGIAQYPTSADVQGLSEAADKALYVAKESGRNQVILSQA